MTYNGENALIAKIFAMPLPLIEKRQVFLALTAAGEILDADLMLQGLKEFLEKAKTQTWLLDENHPDLGEWLELVAFSNRPSAIKEALAMLPPQARQPWRLRPLISSLQYLPDNPEEILNAIATDYPEFKDTREWQEALLSFGLKSSTFDLLEALATTKGRSKLDEWHTAQQIAERVRTDPLLRQDAIKRFSGEANSLQPLMRRVLVEISSPNCGPEPAECFGCSATFRCFRCVLHHRHDLSQIPDRAHHMVHGVVRILGHRPDLETLFRRSLHDRPPKIAPNSAPKIPRDAGAEGDGGARSGNRFGTP
ncbi:MAG: hypothetical protein JSR78_08455 [Proteobacteria bacterium]|nr:hypothetical protein [Pseudomonadota bacterium]